jgi:prolipoprotein diacylglyceryltransferase
VISATFLISYGVLRFLTDIVRTHDERVLGLTGAQYMCLVLIPFGLWVLWTAFRPVPEADVADADIDDDPFIAEPDLKP